MSVVHCWRLWVRLFVEQICPIAWLEVGILREVEPQKILQAIKNWNMFGAKCESKDTSWSSAIFHSPKQVSKSQSQRMKRMSSM
jgi:hypothetical protein